MGPFEKLTWMIAHCERQQELLGSKEATVTFAGLKGSLLFGRSGPRGVIVCENQDRTFVVAFNSEKVIRACRKVIQDLASRDD